MSYTAVIIDDEWMGRTVLREKIKSHLPMVQIVGEAENGGEGKKMIDSLQPAIVFLDIEMPDMTGFEMIDQLDFKDFSLIFTTAYDQYAIKAFKYGAIDYLLKPIDIVELVTLFNKVKVESSQTKFLWKSHDLTLISEYLKVLNRKTSKIAVPDMSGITFVDLDDMVYLKADNNYTIITRKADKAIVSSKTLKEYDNVLSELGFFRCHVSYLVHIKYIKKYIKGDGGQVEMINNVRIDVSRKRKLELLQIIERF